MNYFVKCTRRVVIFRFSVIKLTPIIETHRAVLNKILNVIIYSLLNKRMDSHNSNDFIISNI